MKGSAGGSDYVRVNAGGRPPQCAGDAARDGRWRARHSSSEPGRRCAHRRHCVRTRRRSCHSQPQVHRPDLWSAHSRDRLRILALAAGRLWPTGADSQRSDLVDCHTIDQIRRHPRSHAPFQGLPSSKLDSRRRATLAAMIQLWQHVHGVAADEPPARAIRSLERTDDTRLDVTEEESCLRCGEEAAQIAVAIAGLLVR